MPPNRSMCALVIIYNKITKPWVSFSPISAMVWGDPWWFFSMHVATYPLQLETCKFKNTFILSSFFCFYNVKNLNFRAFILQLQIDFLSHCNG